ncbi:hypothetical protein A6P39_039535 [Streptomyces sp. FXJ1.172]|uniref:hypothetical protein n=1 Tax=Streptomyces sp. FXJ1.172 TaxID=710705 RepID=UPI0007D0255B|nr:hypothetical protein [Streptomyces sp. FXJ1.172]WEO99655.1 hypothetical protein A6P39_039535 [Streptomyces sp. FXJ1.172]
MDEDLETATKTIREHSARYAAVIEDGAPVGHVCADDPAREVTSAPTVAPTPDLHSSVDPGE